MLECILMYVCQLKKNKFIITLNEIKTSYLNSNCCYLHYKQYYEFDLLKHLISYMKVLFTLLHQGHGMATITQKHVQ